VSNECGLRAQSRLCARQRHGATIYPEGWELALRVPEGSELFLMRWLAILVGLAALGGGAALARAQAAQPTAEEKK